ncbi:hypothetical protein AVEN_260859-1 [Araneus ventricosus]|uniref:Uncharacterized protein n=1 Tax=Araneus ventricosus TaxID=182803 RepID=A0A4Y2VTA5_ARAVE|nr:hypothetical protein AVEN_260859-1 [Araneus ventricosus]
MPLNSLLYCLSNVNKYHPCKLYFGSILVFRWCTHTLLCWTSIYSESFPPAPQQFSRVESGASSSLIAHIPAATHFLRQSDVGSGCTCRFVSASISFRPLGKVLGKTAANCLSGTAVSREVCVHHPTAINSLRTSYAGVEKSDECIRPK